MSSPLRNLLVTTALPYANAPLHLGYMVEAIQADIWVRFQKLMGHTCHFVCADDAHGTPVMLLAESQNKRPEDLIQEIYQSHVADLKAFEIGLDHFYTTHSPENQKLAEEIYTTLLQRGDIVKRTIAQAFDPLKNLFLPDRYVKGDCPKCEAPNQYGDNCEQCGATYSPMDLKNPVSVLSGVVPISKESEHYFFCLDHYEAFLKHWLTEGHVQPEVQKKLSEWFKVGLAQWDISRDAPYFGFKIPNTTDKYFYVWLDAPIGYMASFKHYCAEAGIDFESYWSSDSQTELYHFIGKDIIYFHGLFWPALLKGAGFRTPTQICVHGFLTLNGQKMSKSRGTFIQARTYLNHLPPTYLRYYFASKLNDSITDLDLQSQDFVSKVNADLVGKWANIASRCAGFVEKHFNNSVPVVDPTSLEFIDSVEEKILDAYEKRAFNSVTKHVMDIADRVNAYIDTQKPWQLAKNLDHANREKLAHTCAFSLNLFWRLTLYLSPIVPSLAAKAARFFNKDSQNWPAHWQDRHLFLDHQPLNTFEPLIQRLELKRVENFMNSEKNTLSTPPSQTPASVIAPSSSLPARDTVTIDEFNKIDLRVGTIVAAEAVPEAQKLIKLQVDIGEAKPRQIFAGIKEAYEPATLIGKKVTVVANLEPRKMRFGISEGMLLAAGGTDRTQLWLVEPHPETQPGMSIK